MKKPPTDEGGWAKSVASIKGELYEAGEELTAWEEEALPHLTMIKGSESGSRKAEYAKAALDVHLTGVFERAIDRLVASSDGNTRTMSRLTRAYVALTVVLALAAVAGVWISYSALRATSPVPAATAGGPSR